MQPLKAESMVTGIVGVGLGEPHSNGCKEIDLSNVAEVKNALDVRNIGKRYGEFVAVDNLSFAVKQGSIFGLLGPNGAGKTTTIRMILDIFAPDSGEILLLNQRISFGLQRWIGYLPEERGLYKRMKVGEQLLFFARLKGVEAGEARKRIDQWLAKLELSDWKNKKAKELSKGMQQKVQFIAAVLHDPQVLILDEPFSGLDPVSVSLLKGIILELKDQNKTIIFSTHQMEQVEQLCDDICLINHGAKVLGGSLRQVKRGFGRSTLVMDYVGPDSFLEDSRIRQWTRYPNYTEIQLYDDATAQEVLKRALAAGGIVNRFEMVEPSLNEIFIDTVGRKNE